jgi:hypothetical protein
MKPWRNNIERWNAVCERFARSYWMRRLGCATFTLIALMAAVRAAELVAEQVHDQQQVKP